MFEYHSTRALESMLASHRHSFVAYVDIVLSQCPVFVNNGLITLTVTNRYQAAKLLLIADGELMLCISCL